MKRRIYKGGVDNYPLWWYGQSNRLQNFGDRTNFLVPHGAVFKGDGYYFNGNDDYMEDVYGRHLIKEGTSGLWSQLYLTDSAVPPCGSAVGTGNQLYLASGQDPRITGKFVLYPEFCPNLIYFHCEANEISILDISRIITLKYLYCNGQEISVLDVSRLTSLIQLSCPYNNIPSLAVSQLTSLEEIICKDNNLSTLNVSQLTKLNTLNFANNQISTLDVSNNSKITILDCHNNQLDQSAVDKVLCDADAWNTSDGTLDISSNTAPSSTGTDCKNNLVNRNWTVTTD